MSRPPIYSFRMGKHGKALKAKVANSSGDWPVFNIKESLSRPHVTIIQAAPPQRVIATVTFHTLSSNIDITLNGQPIQLRKKDSFSGDRAFFYHAAGELCWKELGVLSSGLRLVNSRGMELCRYKKRHGFDVFVQMNQAFLNVILITGLTTAKYKRMADEGATEAGGEIISALAGA